MGIAAQGAGNVTTIQATGKRWKMLQVVGACMMIGGCVGFVGSASGGGSAEAGASIALLCFVVGPLLFVGARLGAWWHHG